MHNKCTELCTTRMCRDYYEFHKAPPIVRFIINHLAIEKNGKIWIETGECRSDPMS